MIKVLFADDEMIVRVALKSMVHWEETEFEVVGVVSDGKSAWEAVQKLHPHIVVTDLKMPGFDGMWLCRMLYEDAFPGRVIVLSSYGEFELAREAMRYGVTDYLLKANFTDRELLAALRKAAASLPTESTASHRTANKCAPLVFEPTQIRDMLYIPDNQPEPCDYTGLWVALYVFKKELLLNGVYRDGPEQGALDALPGLAGECAGDTGIVVPLSENEAVLLFQVDSVQQSMEAAALYASKISANVRIYMNTQVGFVLSEPVQGAAQLQLALRTCAKSARLALYRGFAQVWQASQAQCYTVELPDEAFASIDGVCESLTMSAYTRAQELAFQALDRLEEDEIAFEDAQRYIKALFEQVTVAYAFYFEHDKEKLSAFALRYRECSCIAEYKAVMADMIDEISISLVKLDESRFQRPILDIITYVKQNIDRRITLAHLSAAVNISESYISRLFKNETGMNLMSYVNMLKMERAMELLKDPAMIVKDVARELGYDDQSYFNRIFNKYFGQSPMEFKRIYQNKTSKGKNNANMAHV